MRIFYRLAAFDRETEELIASYEIPAEMLPRVRDLARIPATDDGAGDYPLGAKQARQIARKLGIKAHPGTAEYFLEPYVLETDVEDRSAGN